MYLLFPRGYYLSIYTIELKNESYYKQATNRQRNKTKSLTPLNIQSSLFALKLTIKKVLILACVLYPSVFEKPSSAECYVSENLFVFNVKPYYLRLRFTGQLVGDDDLIKCRDKNLFNLGINFQKQNMEICEVVLIKYQQAAAFKISYFSSSVVVSF